MADQVPPITPPAPAAAPVAPPAAPAPAAVAPPPAPRPPKNKQPPVAAPVQFDKLPGWKKRLDQEARRKLRRELGVDTDEEVQAFIAKAKAIKDGAAPAGGAPASSEQAPAPAASATPGLDPEVRKLIRLNKKLAERVLKQKTRIVKTKTRARDEVVELELKMEVLRVGIDDEYSEYALSQYKKAARAAAAEEKEIPDPAPFFQTLMTRQPVIARGGAAPVAPAPVNLRPTTSPPASTQPGEQLPNQNTPGGGPPVVNVDDRDDDGNYKMDDRAFKAHKEKYGFRGY